MTKSINPANIQETPAQYVPVCIRTATKQQLPSIITIFADCNQQDATFLNLFISVRRSTCFRRVFRPSSGTQNCTYSVRYLSDRYCYLMLAWPG